MIAYKGCSSIFLAMSFALLASLAGCGGTGGEDTFSGGGGGGGGGGPPGPPPETTVPTVTSMSPGEDSGIAANTGIGTNSKLTATLSEAMDPALITLIDPVTGKPANFRLAQGDTAIAGTASYDATNHIAIFTPAVVLAPNTKYTATIITGIKDLAGNPLTTDFAWCFTTDAIPDVTPPSVTSTIPAAGIGVFVNRKITATFSKDMDGSTITPTSFSVAGPTPVSGTVTYLRRTAVFKPSSSLAPNATYTATITTDVKDLAGNALQANTWSFATGASADLTAPAPVVDPFSPANAATGVAIGTAIKVSFNEPMDPATITTESFTVTVPDATPGAPPVRVIGTVAFDASTNTAIFTRIDHLVTPVLFHPTPVSNLEPNTTYTATLTTGAKDMAGNALASNLVWSFTTVP